MLRYSLKKLAKWALVALCAAALIALIAVLTPDDPAASCLLAKPVIYLYPEQDTVVTVTLGCADNLTASVPEYRGGWRVLARPDGTLTDLVGGGEYASLFWEAEKPVRFDFSRGACVAGSETAAFLADVLTQLGLNAAERAEFLDYWLPRMEGNAYNLIAFQQDAYTAAAPLSISPAPDSVLRVFMAWTPLRAPVGIAPQDFAPFSREGFAAVEWGGCEVAAP